MKWFGEKVSNCLSVSRVISSFGVGIDSIKGHWREWGLFDNGRQPIGHMHSNLLQIALERGVPALIVWLILIGVYVRMLWRHQSAEIARQFE